MDMLLKDRIIPKKWMHKVYRQQWQTMLKVDQGIDKGPKTMSEEEFNENCMRCGRTLNSPGKTFVYAQVLLLTERSFTQVKECGVGQDLTWGLI